MNRADPLVVWAPARIRRCTAEDLAPLEWFGMFTPHREIIHATWAAQQRGDALMLVLELNRFPVGQVWLNLARARDRGIGLIWALRVLPLLQSLGLGRRLLQAAETELWERGYDWAELGIDRDNPRTQQFYEHAGYMETGTEQGWFCYTPPGAAEPVRQWRDEIVMRKWLTGKTPSRFRIAGHPPPGSSLILSSGAVLAPEGKEKSRP
jgi:GNAT superfamily N-acetyltransferase